MGALFHCDKHDVRYAHNTAEQRKQAHHPEERTDDVDTLLHLQVLREAVPYPQGLFILWMRLMLGIQSMAVFLLKVLVGIACRQTVEGKLYTSGIVSIGTIYRLDGRVRREDFGTSVLLFLINTYYLKGEVAYIDKGAYLDFQLLGLLIAQHQHFTPFFQVYLINETALQHLHLVNLGVIRIDTADGGGDILLTKTDGGRGAILCTHLVDILRKLLSSDVDVLLMQTDVTSFLQALIGFRRPSTKDDH